MSRITPLPTAAHSAILLDLANYDDTTLRSETFAALLAIHSSAAAVADAAAAVVFLKARELVDAFDGLLEAQDKIQEVISKASVYSRASVTTSWVNDAQQIELLVPILGVFQTCCVQPLEFLFRFSYSLLHDWKC